MAIRSSKNIWLILLAFCAACGGPSSVRQSNAVLRHADVDLLSKAMQEQVEKHSTVLQHKLVNRYVNSLGQSMVARNTQMPPLAYQFRVLRENDLNAFSLPGGTIYVTLGMLSRLEFEGQFAAAIAHELAHQDAGHALILWRERVTHAEQWLNSSNVTGRDEFENLYFGKSGLLYYGDKYESEADEVAMVILYQAGYDPRAYLSYLEALLQISDKNPKSVRMLMEMHQPLETRLARVREYLRLLPPKRESKLTSATFQEVKHLLGLADKMKTKNGAAPKDAKPTKPGVKQ